MALDAIPTYPSEYDGTGTTNNPPGSDSRRQGDDQLRILKANMKQTWPEVDAAVNVSAAQLNTLTDIATSQTIETRLTALDNILPGGGVTFLVFKQASAPTGWTQDATDQSMMRVVATAGGGTGGTDDPILNDKIPSHTHGFTTGGAGGHTHGLYKDGGANFQAGMIDSLEGLPTSTKTDQGSAGVAAVGNHTHPGTTDANAGASNWQPKYVDVICASRD